MKKTKNTKPKACARNGASEKKSNRPVTPSPTTTTSPTIAKSDIPPFHGLSIRTPNELMAMQFPTEDIYLADGIFAKQQGMTVLGPAGVGKTRLTLQLATSTIIGRPFVGLPVCCTDKRWLIIQAENGNRRLQFDLQKHRTAFREALNKGHLGAGYSCR